MDTLSFEEMNHVEYPKYVEMLMYAAMSHFVSPFVPNVPAMGACSLSSKRELKILPHIASKSSLVGDMDTAELLITLEEH
jgi:hypothetical protein